MVLSVQCTLQDAGKYERNSSVSISFRVDYSIWIYMYLVQLVSNILILISGRRFSFHLGVTNRHDWYLFLLSE
jgi:hypothetical protein